MSSEARQAASSLPYPEKYHAAVKFVETVAVGSKALKDEAQLLLYGLRQQVTEGPCSVPKPWAWNVVETAKWQSWHHLGNLSAMEAMRLYVRTLEEEQANWYTLLQEAPEPSKLEPTPSTASPDKVATAVAEPASHTVLRPAVDYAKEGAWALLPLDDQKRPLPRYEHSAGLVAGSIYVIGGNYGGRYLSDCWKLNLTTCQWTQLALKAAESAEPGASADGKASEVTPADGAAAPLLPPALAPLAGHQVVAYKGNLIVLGGHVKGKDAKSSLTVRVIDTAKQTAATVATTGAPAARGGHTASIIGSKVFVFGGEDAGRRTLGDLHALDLPTMTWSEPTTSGPKPSPRSAHAAAVYNSRWLVIFGGGSVATCYNDVSVLDTQTLTWSVPPVVGVKVTPRAGHAGGVLGDAWYLVGGGNNVKGCTEMFALDLSAVPSGGPLTWSSVLSIPMRDPLSSEGISILPLVESRVLVAFGGYNGKYQNSVHVFRPAHRSATPSATPTANGTASEGGAATPSSTPKGPKEDSSAPTPSTSSGGAVANGTSSSKPPPTSAGAASAAPESKTPTAAAAATAASPETLADVKAQLDAARKEVDAALKEVAAAKGSATHELKLLRSQLATAQAGQAETQKLLEDARAAHQREQAKVLKLEAEAAELSRRLGGMADLEKEVEKYRRAAREAEEAKAKAAGGGGLWGYLSGAGGGGGDASSSKA